MQLFAAHAACANLGPVTVLTSNRGREIEMDRIFQVDGAAPIKTSSRIHPFQPFQGHHITKGNGRCRRRPDGDSAMYIYTWPRRSGALSPSTVLKDVRGATFAV